MMKYITLIFSCFLFNTRFNLCFGGNEPNPPNWPSGVYVFDPSDPTTSQNIINEAFANNGGMDPETNGQWSSYRYAFLFKQGSHNVDMTIGYYTTVHGLGIIPSDVEIQSVSVEDGSENYQLGALDNFWRSAEKLCQIIHLRSSTITFFFANGFTIFIFNFHSCLIFANCFAKQT